MSIVAVLAGWAPYGQRRALSAALYLGQCNPTLSMQVAKMLSDYTTNILHKKPDLTSIAIQYIEPEHWMVGGPSLAAQGKSSAFVEIRITDETNTRSEKAAYIKAVYEGLRALMPDLHHESYIHVHDVRAGAYGYGGQTQEYRAHKA